MPQLFHNLCKKISLLLKDHRHKSTLLQVLGKRTKLGKDYKLREKRFMNKQNNSCG